MPQLNLKSDQRIGAIGRTGTGKTFLMERLLKPQPRVLVVDSKKRVKWPGYSLTENATAAMVGDKIIYRHDEAIPSSFWMDAMDALHERGGGIIYIDELPVITTPNSIPEGLRKVFRLGREIGVGVWWSAQEATGVSNVAIRQSDILLMFLNHGASDRDKLIRTTGDMGEATANLEFYEFLVFQSFGKVYDSSAIPVYKYDASELENAA